MAETNPVPTDPEYDVTIASPETADPEDTANPNPSAGDSIDDTPPAGSQEPAPGAVDADGVPVRTDGQPTRAKGEEA